MLCSLRRARPDRLLLLAGIAWPAGGTPLPVSRFRPEPSGFAAYSGIGDSLRVVIGDGASWRAYWQRVHARVAPAPPVPEVDFTRDVVILAALGTRGSGGYGIRIDSAYDAGAYVEVVVRRSAPGSGCLVTAAFTQPVDVVRIPARKVPVRFREHAIVESCH